MNPYVLVSIGASDPLVDVVWDPEQGRCTFLSCMMIDGDGSGDPHNDPDFQARTSYRNPDPVTGAPRWLNADLVPYIVLPPQVILALPGIVLGCRALVTNGLNGMSQEAVVGDVGPHLKIGEGSIALARALCVPESPTTGGIDRRVIRYAFWPGVPAVVNGVTYALEPYDDQVA